MRLDDASPRTWLLAATAGWSVVVGLLALAGMGRTTDVLPADPSLVKALPTARKPAASQLGPLTQYSEIGARPLFTDDRRPKPFLLPGKGEAEGQSSAFDFQLTSVILTPQLKMAFLQPPDGSTSMRVKLGEAPESHGSWRLTSLEPRKAVFEGPDGRREMELRVFNGQGGEPPTVVGPPPGTVIAPPGQAIRAVPPPPPPQSPNPSPSPRSAMAQPMQNVPPKPVDTTVPGMQPMTEQAQMEAIRRRIEARRAQLRQQQAAQPPAKSP